MTQPDEITLTPEGKEGELLSYISDLKKEKQQAIDDVKLLRAVVSEGLFGLGFLPVNMHMIEVFTKALAATKW